MQPHAKGGRIGRPESVGLLIILFGSGGMMPRRAAATERHCDCYGDERERRQQYDVGRAPTRRTANDWRPC